MKLIYLTNGGAAIVDDMDYQKLSAWKWRASNKGYAYRTVKVDGKTQKLLMHHALVGRVPGLEVDHKNRNPLDNQRENLRLVPHWVNCHNRTTRPSKSGQRGVSKPKGRNKWRAVIYINKRHINLGYFETMELAIEARANAERQFQTNP